jgi:multifunctional 2-oxoglutarate metabolism enzyme
MSAKSDTEMGINSWLEDELYQQYLRDRSTVDESWKEVFGATAPASKAVAVTAAAVAQAPAAPAAPGVPLDGEQLQPLRGIAGKIAENMEASLAIPLATSQRTIAVKVMDENRRIINQHRTLVGQGKVSYTHLRRYRGSITRTRSAADSRSAWCTPKSIWGSRWTWRGRMADAR